MPAMLLHECTLNRLVTRKKDRPAGTWQTCSLALHKKKTPVGLDARQAFLQAAAIACQASGQHCSLRRSQHVVLCPAHLPDEVLVEFALEALSLNSTSSVQLLALVTCCLADGAWAPSIVLLCKQPEAAGHRMAQHVTAQSGTAQHDTQSDAVLHDGDTATLQ